MPTGAVVAVVPDAGQYKPEALAKALKESRTIEASFSIAGDSGLYVNGLSGPGCLVTPAT